jgi:hypothetical protein
MAYSIIQPPFTLRFREMLKSELKAYYAWFVAILPERVAGLEAAVRESPLHATWRADATPESLNALGTWFEKQVEVRQKTEEEVEEIKARMTFPIEVSGEQLTNRTFSLAMDVGMYFSQVVLKNLAGTHWDQPLKNQRLADHGQPVIVGFGGVSLNPVRVCVTTAYGVSRKKPARLGQLYETWAKMHRAALT